MNVALRRPMTLDEFLAWEGEVDFPAPDAGT
jgi:hypothetical protein